MSKGDLSAVKNLAEGKDNLKRPMAEEHHGEKDYEPTERKVTRSNMNQNRYVFHIEENYCKCYKVARIFIHLYGTVEYSCKQLSFLANLRRKIRHKTNKPGCVGKRT